MILAFDVGFKATGWCWTTGQVVHLGNGTSSQEITTPARILCNAGVIVPTDGLSTKALREKRACEREALQDLRLFRGIRDAALYAKNLCETTGGKVFPLSVVAEVPAMGSISAASARQMAASLACFEAAMNVVEEANKGGLLEVERYLRSDVVSAMFGKRRPTGDIKDVTRKVVLQRMALRFEQDLSDDLKEHAYDAAATLFAARDAPSVRSQRWSEAAMGCLRMVGR